MMKNRLLMVFAVLSLSLFSVASAGALQPGEVAPSLDVKMMSVDGNEFSIADVKGDKGTLVVFTCNACPYAKAWEDRIVALGNEYSAKGIGVIAQSLPCCRGNRDLERRRCRKAAAKTPQDETTKAGQPSGP